jgi:hypothetical protein
MADFGAEVAGVRRLLPTIEITEATTPSEEDVAAWLAEFSGEVGRRIGGLLAAYEAGSSELAELTAAGARLVYFAVAATVYDAHYPERAGTDGGYGAVLWQRYTAGLDALDTDDLTDAGDGGAAAAGATLDASFPEPMFPDDFDTRV